MKRPIAVLISDVHYNLNTLELADKAMRMAINKANSLKVPLIVAGDLHDTKANLRGECVNRMIETFYTTKTEVYVLRGNHDSLNEKSNETALKFLDGINRLTLVNTPLELGRVIYMVPYSHDTEALRAYLKTIPKISITIMHQGLKTTNSGEYGDHDKTAININDVAGLTIISGHYHARQSIDLPNNGVWRYIGNPYTLTFGEARDPEKGFQVLYDDGSLKFIPTNLRKHIIFDMSAKEVGPQTVFIYNPDDLLWLKISGTKEELSKLTRESVISRLNITCKNVRLDFSSFDTRAADMDVGGNGGKVADIGLDDLIVASSSSDEQKERLKKLWREMV